MSKLILGLWVFNSGLKNKPGIRAHFGGHAGVAWLFLIFVYVANYIQNQIGTQSNVGRRARWQRLAAAFKFECNRRKISNYVARRRIAERPAETLGGCRFVLDLGTALDEWPAERPGPDFADRDPGCLGIWFGPSLIVFGPRRGAKIYYFRACFRARIPGLISSPDSGHDLAPGIRARFQARIPGAKSGPPICF